jgi:hypothetical protein
MITIIFMTLLQLQLPPVFCWTKVVNPTEKINFNLDETPFEFISDDSKDATLNLFDGSDNPAGMLSVRGESNNFFVEGCFSGRGTFAQPLPGTPGSKKIWRITKIKKANDDILIKFHCNDIQVLFLTLKADCEVAKKSSWSNLYNKKVEKMSFAASGYPESYRPYTGVCSAGNYRTEGDCKECTENTYSAGGKATSCSKCPGDGKSAAGATSEKECQSQKSEYEAPSDGYRTKMNTLLLNLFLIALLI